MIMVSYSGGKFICRCAFEERDVPRRAGFTFDASLKLWTTPSNGVAARLRPFLDDSAKKQLERSLITVNPWTGPVSIPKGKKPHGFQIDSALFSLARNRSYLALDPGLGKTAIAAIIARTLNASQAGRYSFVYISPPFLTRTVEEELAAWGAPQMPIVPDSMLHKSVFTEHFKSTLKAGSHEKTLFVDEAHRYKNMSAKRTEALFTEIIPLFDRVVFMSGTPMPNRAMELYPILSHCAPETIDFMDMFSFGRKYCGGHRTKFGWSFSGTTKMDELSARVKDTFMIRVRKKDALPELPPKVEEVLIVERDMPVKLARMDATLLRHHSPEDLMRDQFSTARHQNGEELHLSTYRKELGLYKVPCAVDVITALLEDTDEAILVFAIHTEVIAELVWGLSEHNPFVITGSTPMDKRHAYVKEFQRSDKARLFIGNIQAMGVGFTLTKATRVVFVEFSWVPTENSQASDRAHRIGQKDSVYCQYLVYRNSIDKTVLETNLRKVRDTEKL